jgi:hypothetical protein
MEQFCTSDFLSYSYGFGAAECSTMNYVDDNGVSWRLQDGDAFDPKSIMEALYTLGTFEQKC